MKDGTPAALRRLVGTHLTDVGRAADLQCFTFTNAQTEAAGIALHIACPWRVSNAGRIVVGAGDYWRPASADVGYDSAFDTGAVRSRLLDVGNAAMRDVIAQHPPVVLTATTDPVGGVRLELSDGYVIEAFPDAACVDHDESEFWRLFEPDGPHLVVSSDGLDYSA
jgi:hypothetical protein